jgi:hypothetical protein
MEPESFRAGPGRGARGAGCLGPTPHTQRIVYMYMHVKKAQRRKVKRAPAAGRPETTANASLQGRPGKIRGPVQNFKMRVSKLIMYIDCNILGSNQIYQEYG